jgi:hypothetical protein
MELVQATDMLAQPFITLDQPISFADVLGPEWIAYTNPDQSQLLSVEGQVRNACAKWTRFFETMTDPD